MGSRRVMARLVCLGAAALVAAGALAAAEPPSARAATVVLTVKGPAGKIRNYTLAQLKSGFTAYKGYAGYVKTGFVGMQKPHPVKGVRLLDVLKKVGYKSGSVIFTAADGYKLTYSSNSVHGKKVKMHKASPPKYRTVTMGSKNPLTAILAYQDKKVGARVSDSNRWRNYKKTYATSGSDGVGPLRFWWAYRKWVNPGYVQIGWSSMRMVRTLKVK